MIILLQIVAVLFYLVGDNIYYAMNRYGGCLCNSNCIDACFYAAKLLSGIAAIVYAIAKSIKEHTNDDKSEDEGEKEWLDFLPMIAVIAQMDLLYTIATSNSIGLSKEYVSIVLLIFAVLLGSILIINKAIRLAKENRDFIIIIIIMATLIGLSLTFHTLGDNMEPLDTGINCTTQMQKVVNCLDEDSCLYNSIARLVLDFVALMLVSIPTMYSLCSWIDFRFCSG